MIALELFGQVYMYFLMFMGVCIGIGAVILGYGFKGFLAGAFFTIAFGMISFTFAAVLLTIFVNIALKSIREKANKILIPLIILGLVVDVSKYISNKEDDEIKNEDKYEYEEMIEEAINSDLLELDSNTNDSITSNEEDYSDISESGEEQTIQVDLDAVPVTGASNTVESASEQIGYLIMYYLEAYAGGDTASLGYYVDSASTFYSEQMKYMESLNNRGITLDLIDYEIISMEQVIENQFKVIVKEYYTIDNPEKGFSDTEQTSTYTVNLIDGEYYITGLEL